MYPLLYEDRSRNHAIWVPGTERKEEYTLKLYQDDIRKDYKRIIVFLFTDRKLMLAEEISDEVNSRDESIGKPKKYCKFYIHPGLIITPMNVH